MTSLAPFGMPAGVNPLEWRRAAAARLDELLDAATNLITALDMMEVDPDLEPEFDDDEDQDKEHGEADEDDGTREPSLGSVASNPATSQAYWAQGKGSDREEDAGEEPELENEHGDPSDEEPNLGWGNSQGQTGVGLAKDWSPSDPDDISSDALVFRGEGQREAERLLREKGPRQKLLDSSHSNVVMLTREELLRYGLRVRLP